MKRSGRAVERRLPGRVKIKPAVRKSVILFGQPIEVKISLRRSSK